MDNAPLMEAMIEACREIIIDHDDPGSRFPPAIRSQHLIWMCDRMVAHLDRWSDIKLNRWIGFIQGAMIANNMVDLDEAKAIFDQAKNAFAEPSQDWLDHLDPDNPFEFDIGGQG